MWSDVVCPWCYIGKRKLERALDRWDGEPVEVVWRPFELNPQLKSTGAAVREVLAGKLGSEAVAEQAMHRSTTAAESEGLRYEMSKAIAANTFDAHRLVSLAREQGVQHEVKERFFRAHFVEGENLGDPETLVRLAGQTGLTGAADALVDDALAARLRDELAEGVAIGVRSVPTYVVGNRGVAGAQDPDVILDLLRSAP
ncbi:DsbA family oxidoreductase [Saccharothrix texasensis]|uniref:DsbA family oxidoreductase n=1 Tax=Saccharothrix texasensis TaxID=103734 RepID=UPI00147710D6|nr:DsbA family oxidoreductase [Saccharothrix texasensis]